MATTAAIALYSVQIATGVPLREELLRTCDTHPSPHIFQYFWVTMLLSAVGVGAALAAAISAYRRLIRFTAVAIVVVCGVLFLLAWYGFSVRNDTIGPLCSNM